MKGKVLLTILYISTSLSGMSRAMWIMIFGDKLSTERMQSGVSFSVAGLII